MTPSRKPEYQKKNTAKIQAIILLQKLGWTFISPEKALRAREGKLDQVILRKILNEQLAKRRFSYADGSYSLSSQSIHYLMDQIINPIFNEGLLSANEKIYNHLLHGMSITECINNKTINPTISLIDWENPKSNSFVFSADFSISQASGRGIKKLDIICFVNGIPLVVIQAMTDDEKRKNPYAMETIISQLMQWQRHNEVPGIFACCQLLLAIDGGDGRYATLGAPVDRWANWYEDDISDLQIRKLKNKKLSLKQQNDLLSGYAESDFNPELCFNSELHFSDTDSVISNQDRLLIGLLSSKRLLEVVRYFILFDKKFGRIIAYPHQVFAARRVVDYLSLSTIKKAEELVKGGIIYHRPGSNKSITLMFLIRVLLNDLSFKKYRIIVATDCDYLDEKLNNIFVSGNKLIDKKEAQSIRATSGSRLAEEIGKGNQRIILTRGEKFAIAIKLPECINSNPDILVLIDSLPDVETQLRMKKTLPYAVFIAFSDFSLSGKDESKNLLGSVIYSSSNRQIDNEEKIITRELYKAPEASVTASNIDYIPYLDYFPEKFINASQTGIREETSVYQVDPVQKLLQELFKEPLENIPELDSHQSARIYFAIFKKILPENFFTPYSERKKWLNTALVVDKLVETAIADNSINFHNIESDIRRKLLPLLFLEYKAIGIDMNHTKQIVDLIVKSVYLRVDLD